MSQLFRAFFILTKLLIEDMLSLIVLIKTSVLILFFAVELLHSKNSPQFFSKKMAVFVNISPEIECRVN